MISEPDAVSFTARRHHFLSVTALEMLFKRLIFRFRTKVFSCFEAGQSEGQNARWNKGLWVNPRISGAPAWDPDEREGIPLPGMETNWDKPISFLKHRPSRNRIYDPVRIEIHSLRNKELKIFIQREENIQDLTPRRRRIWLCAHLLSYRV